MTPTVSVIIPTYNYSSVLRYAIETVLWQTFSDWELIVVGDCCTDDSEAVVRSFGDARIRWINLPENSGSKSLPQNAGVQVARAELIAYLAHDDLWHPSHLATVVGAIKESSADFVHTVAAIVPPPGETMREVFGIFPGSYPADHAFVHSTVIHPKRVFDVIGPWPDGRKTRLPGDQTFWNRAVAAGLRFQAVPKLTTWKINASSRPGCYLEQRSDEQAHCFAQLRDDPDFPEKELIEVIRSAIVHGLKLIEGYKVGRDTPPGAHHHLLRQIRGLEPIEPMMALAVEGDLEPFRVAVVSELPSVVGAGARMDVEVRIENRSGFAISSQKPNPVHFSYHWLGPDGSMALWDGQRSQIVPPLPARETLHYVVNIYAPTSPGVYELEPTIVQEGVRWFQNAEPGARLSIEVAGV
jgi:hypothetical protein